MQGLLGYTIRRLLWLPVILFVVSFLAFSITRFGPGDYVDVLAGPRVTLRRRSACARRPASTTRSTCSTAHYMKRLLTEGDFGESFTIYRGVDVWDIIWPRILVSMQPGFVALFITFSLGIPVGIFAALKQGTWLDPFSIGSFLFFQSIPVLVSLPFLVLLFVVKLGWLPGDRLGRPARRRRAAEDRARHLHASTSSCPRSCSRCRASPASRDSSAQRRSRCWAKTTCARPRQGPAGAAGRQRATSRATRSCRS